MKKEKPILLTNLEHKKNKTPEAKKNNYQLAKEKARDIAEIKMKELEEGVDLYFKDYHFEQRYSNPEVLPNIGFVVFPSIKCEDFEITVLEDGSYDLTTIKGHAYTINHNNLEFLADQYNDLVESRTLDDMFDGVNETTISPEDNEAKTVEKIKTVFKIDNDINLHIMTENDTDMIKGLGFDIEELVINYAKLPNGMTLGFNSEDSYFELVGGNRVIRGETLQELHHEYLIYKYDQSINLKVLEEDINEIKETGIIDDVAKYDDIDDLLDNE
jgi:hypothetical protein